MGASERGTDLLCGLADTRPADQQIGRQQNQPEDRHRKRARRHQAHAGEAEDRQLQQRPDRQRGGGVEVSGHMPGSSLQLADRRIAVPSLIGVLGPVHPRRVVGKVGGEMQIVQREQAGREDQQNRLRKKKRTPRVEERRKHTQTATSGLGDKNPYPAQTSQLA